MNISDLVVWVTGASSGIGLAVAEELAKRNATVILSSRSKERLANAIATIGNQYRTFLLPCDVSNPESVQEVYSKMFHTNLKVNVLINNAGVYHYGPFVSFPLEKFDESFAVNVRGVFLCTKTVLPYMIESKFGIIVNIISIVVNKIFPNSSVYSATKSAILAMSNSLREELRSNNIKIMNVYPGATATNIWSESVLKRFSEKMMSPHSVAKAIVDNIELMLQTGIMVEDLILRPQTGDL